MRNVLRLKSSSHSFSLSLLPLHPFLVPVGLYWIKWEPVGVCLDPRVIRIALCNPPLTGKSVAAVLTRVCSENSTEVKSSGAHRFHPRSVLPLTCVLSRL